MIRLLLLTLALSCGLQSTSSWAVLVANRPQVTIRSDATIQAPKVEVVVQGEELQKIRRKGDWFQVRLPDGRNGWVHYSLVVEREDTPAAKSASKAPAHPSQPHADEPAPEATPKVGAHPNRPTQTRTPADEPASQPLPPEPAPWVAPATPLALAVPFIVARPETVMMMAPPPLVPSPPLPKLTGAVGEP